MQEATCWHWGKAETFSLPCSIPLSLRKRVFAQYQYDRDVTVPHERLGRRSKVLTGCKFSVAQMLHFSAQIKGNRIRRGRGAKKNAWDSEPA